MQNYRPGTFDSRIIEYEKVHQISDEQINALIKAVSLKPNQKVLDGCSGYGSVTKWLLERAPQEITETCSFYLRDDSTVQIERAESNLKKWNNIEYTTGKIESPAYPDDFFDIVVIKMGLHENPKKVQADMVRDVFRILRPGGTFVVWELYLNEKTQPIFQSFMHKKDSLAGFDTLARIRYFPRSDEIKEHIISSGFENFKENYIFNPVLSTKVRLRELISRELKESNKTEPDETLNKLANKRLHELNEFFRNELTDDQKKVIKFEDTGDSITIYNIDKAIVTANKPA